MAGCSGCAEWLKTWDSSRIERMNGTLLLPEAQLCLIVT